MNEKDFLNNLLYIMNSLTFTVNLKSKTVNDIRNGKLLIGTNMSYEFFANEFIDIFKLNDDSKGKILRFLTHLNPSDEPFSLTIQNTLESGEQKKFVYTGIKYDKDNVLFAVRLDEEINNDKKDPLTRTYTKNFIIEKIKEAIKEKKEFALMVLDIDNFKLFNDTYGHMFGDIILVETAASIKKFLTNNGYIARIGGDEFLAMVYVKNDYDLIHNACHDLRDAIKNLSKHNIKQETITATVGCASYPKDGDNYVELFKKADKALYRGKRKGRNCFVIYSEEKCGSISDEEVLKEKTIDRFFNASNNYNIIAAIFEMLNRRTNIVKNIEDSLSLIGNYFILDRITVTIMNPDTEKFKEQFTWFNPQSDKQISFKSSEEMVKLWRESYDKTGMLKIVQLDANTHLPVYDLLKSQGTTAILAFEMTNEKKCMGQIRFDMCSINKYWQQNDVSSLMLISKIFAIALLREHNDEVLNAKLNYDSLTKLYNYSKWRYVINSYILGSDNKYSIIDITFENFKKLNEVLGTNACDKALEMFGTSINNISKELDITACRVSGDRFLVYSKEHDQDIIKGVFDKISNNYFKTTNSDRFKIICGVYICDDNADLPSSIDKANFARRYRKGGDAFTLFSDEMYQLQLKKSQLELHMYEAKENGEFLLYLQPKVNTKTNEVIGAEALTRWNYNFQELIFPNIFIPLFESNGFITELDYQVFENVCKFQRQVLDEGKTPIKISVNVSRYQQNFDEYLERINNIRIKYNISPSLIEIEITEGMYVNNSDEISDFMDKLHGEGYTISMDDFGSGYSNLSSLANLNFDLIKLDKNFCSNQENEKETIILSMIMKLTKKLKLKVLCEGVETQDYADYLKSIGCDIVQGYLYDKPIPASQFKEKYIDNAPISTGRKRLIFK